MVPTGRNTRGWIGAIKGVCVDDADLREGDKERLGNLQGSAGSGVGVITFIRWMR